MKCWLPSPSNLREHSHRFCSTCCNLVWVFPRPRCQLCYERTLWVLLFKGGISSGIISSFGRKYSRFRSDNYKACFLQVLLVPNYLKIMTLSLEKLETSLALISLIQHLWSLSLCLQHMALAKHTHFPLQWVHYHADVQPIDKLFTWEHLRIIL